MCRCQHEVAESYKVVTSGVCTDVPGFYPIYDADECQNVPASVTANAHGSGIYTESSAVVPSNSSHHIHNTCSMINEAVKAKPGPNIYFIAKSDNTGTECSTQYPCLCQYKGKPTTTPQSQPPPRRPSPPPASNRFRLPVPCCLHPTACSFPDFVIDVATATCVDQTQCGPGQKISHFDATVVGNCSTCPTGQYQTATDHRLQSCTAQQNCPAGQFASSLDLVSAAVCADCPAGQFTATDGLAESCTACATGQYQPATDKPTA